jgi:hypothetical protein
MKNWKTTAAGFGAAFAYAFIAAITTGLTPKDAAVSAGLALLGSLAKDHNVTGGTVVQ